MDPCLRSCTGVPGHGDLRGMGGPCRKQHQRGQTGGCGQRWRWRCSRRELQVWWAKPSGKPVPFPLLHTSMRALFSISMGLLAAIASAQVEIDVPIRFTGDEDQRSVDGIGAPIADSVVVNVDVMSSGIVHWADPSTAADTLVLSVQPPITEARPLQRQRPQPLAQRPIVPATAVTTARSRNLQKPAGMPLAELVIDDQPPHFRASLYEPREFFRITDCRASLSRLSSATRRWMRWRRSTAAPSERCRPKMV